MNREREKLQKAFESCNEKMRRFAGDGFKPEVAVVLGSGLGDFANETDKIGEIAYNEIDGFPISTVPGHEGRFVFGYSDGVPTAVMQGRVHYYEGYPITDVVLPVRLMKLIGAKTLILTNASGALNPEFEAGDFMLITDQITNFVPNPLIGENFDELGTRFPDMSGIYDKELREKFRLCAKEAGVKLREGVYIQLTGPNFESPAEVRMCRLLGGDAVGMSTAVEAVAAKHAGFKIAGISAIANLGCGLTDNPLTHKEVIEASAKSAPVFKQLLREFIKKAV